MLQGHWFCVHFTAGAKVRDKVATKCRKLDSGGKRVKRIRTWFSLESLESLDRLECLAEFRSALAPFLHLDYLRIRKLDSMPLFNSFDLTCQMFGMNSTISNHPSLSHIHLRNSCQAKCIEHEVVTSSPPGSQSAAAILELSSSWIARLAKYFTSGVVRDFDDDFIKLINKIINNFCS